MSDRKKYMREYQRKWKAENRERVLEMERARYHAQTPEQKAEKVAKNKERRIKLRAEAIKKYGGKCNCCAETIEQFLCIDHMGGGGNQHRKEMTTKSIGEWLYVNNYPEGFQVLCHNCNMAEGIYGKCPHNN